MIRSRKDKEAERKFDETLSRTLSNYPAIWNNKLHNNNKCKRHNAMRAIATFLGTSVQHITKRYIFLRQKYRREKMRETMVQNGEAAAIGFTPWPLMENMRFLDPVHKPLSPKPTTPIAPIKQEDESCQLQDTTEEWLEAIGKVDDFDETWSPVVTTLASTPPLSPAAPTEPEPTMSKAHNERQERTAEDATAAALMERLIAAAESMTAEIDKKNDNCNYVFGQYVRLELDSLPEELAAKARYLMTGILYDLKCSRAVQ